LAKFEANQMKATRVGVNQLGIYCE